jgi:hypothetical protein
MPSLDSYDWVYKGDYGASPLQRGRMAELSRALTGNTTDLPQTLDWTFRDIVDATMRHRLIYHLMLIVYTANEGRFDRQFFSDTLIQGLPHKDQPCDYVLLSGTAEFDLLQLALRTGREHGLALTEAGSRRIIHDSYLGLKNKDWLKDKTVLVADELLRAGNAYKKIMLRIKSAGLDSGEYCPTLIANYIPFAEYPLDGVGRSYEADAAFQLHVGTDIALARGLSGHTTISYLSSILKGVTIREFGQLLSNPAWDPYETTNESFRGKAVRSYTLIPCREFVDRFATRVNQTMGGGQAEALIESARIRLLVDTDEPDWNMRIIPTVVVRPLSKVALRKFLDKRRLSRDRTDSCALKSAIRLITLALNAILLECFVEVGCDGNVGPKYSPDGRVPPWLRQLVGEELANQLSLGGLSLAGVIEERSSRERDQWLGEQERCRSDLKVKLRERPEAAEDDGEARDGPEVLVVTDKHAQDAYRTLWNTGPNNKAPLHVLAAKVGVTPQEVALYCDTFAAIWCREAFEETNGAGLKPDAGPRDCLAPAYRRAEVTPRIEEVPFGPLGTKLAIVPDASYVRRGFLYY